MSQSTGTSCVLGEAVSLVTGVNLKARAIVTTLVLGKARHRELSLRLEHRGWPGAGIG